MSGPFSEIALGPAAVDYVQGHLAKGHRLARYVGADLLPVRRAFTLLPRDVTHRNLDTFEEGGRLPTEITMDSGTTRIPDMNAALCQHIHAFVSRDAERACILENALARSGDVHLARLPHLVFHEPEVYHLIRQPYRTTNQIIATIKAAKSVQELIGVMTTLPNGLGNAISNSPYLSEADLRELAKAWQAVFVGAYDGESYIIVER